MKSKTTQIQVRRPDGSIEILDGEWDAPFFVRRVWNVYEHPKTKKEIRELRSMVMDHMADNGDGTWRYLFDDHWPKPPPPKDAA